MKNLLPLAIVLLSFLDASAHDHIETELDSSDPSRLSVFGEFAQTVTYFPFGEKASLDLQNLPGAAYICELTFSAFDNASLPPNGALIRADILSVEGPEGGSFSFWEVGATTPTWTRPTGWSASASDHPDFYVSEINTGYGHIHGRAFTMDRAGNYTVTFQVVDEDGNYESSNPFVVTFTAINPPRLSIALEGSNIKLGFLSRADLDYDLQSTTTLNSNDWTTIHTLEGDGGTLEFLDPRGGRPKVFYRLVEY